MSIYHREISCIETGSEMHVAEQNSIRDTRLRSIEIQRKIEKRWEMK